MQLRDYQIAAIESIRSSWEQGTGSVLVSLATGLGKTVVMASIPLYVKPRVDDVMMVIVNRDELIEQTVSKLVAVHSGAKIGIEKAESRAKSDSTFIVASVQTLRSKRIDELFARFHGRIGILLIDEAHHATAQSYRNVVKVFFDHRKDGLLVGVTATPQRSDGEGLGSVFDKVVFHRDMIWAIEQGYLVDLRCFQVQSSVDLDAIERRADDFALDQLEAALDVASRNDLVVSAYTQHTPGKQAIAFCPTVGHAEHLSDAFNARGIAAAWASGSSSKMARKAIVDAFRRREVQVLVNCGLYLEGFDVPDVEVIIGCRPTQSAALYIQMTGRGMRPLDEVAKQLGPGTTAESRRQAIAQSKKPFVTVLDIVDQTRRHSLMTLPTLWGLPPKFNVEGQDMGTAAAFYRELLERDPEAAKSVRSVTEIPTALASVDAFAIPVLPREIIEISGMAWRQVTTNHFRLPLPSCFEALAPDGSRIKNFAKRYRAKISEAKSRGAYPFEAYAARELGFDPKTLVEVQEVIDIRPGLSLAFDVFLERNGKMRKLGSVEDLHEAFTRAERWIENNRSDLVSALSSKAEWRSGSPTPNQIRTLSKDFGVPMHLVPSSNGEAQMLIEKLTDERALHGQLLANVS
jgi:superfamily II DNA or RNA helicase